jgi:fluoride exporter
MMRYLMVGIGGFFGAIARFWLGGYIYERMGTRFPYGTFVINCSGCFLIGLVMTILTERTHLDPTWRLLIPIGFIGAYTTFSTFEYETLTAVRDGQFMTGFLNIALSVVVGFLFTWLGVSAGRAVS